MSIELTPLQQQLFDEILDNADGMGYECNSIEMDDIAKDIKTMNAADLRHNIKVFKETR